MGPRLDTVMALARVHDGHLTLLTDTPVDKYVTVDPYGGAILARESTDEGRTFGVSTTIAATGSKPAVEISELDGRRSYYWINGTAIKGKIYDAKGNVLEAEFTAVASGVGDFGIAVRERIIEAGRRTVTLTYIDSGNNVVNVESDDGVTFS